MSLLGRRPSFDSEEDATDVVAKSSAASTPTSVRTNQGNSMSTAPMTTRMTTGEVRGSYVYIFAPRQPRPTDTNKDPKYTITLLIPKSDRATLAKIEAAKEAAIAMKWPQKRPPKIDFTLHDGDGHRPQSGDAFGDECKGHMVIAVSTKNKPEVRDIYRQEIVDASQAVSGDYFKVSLNFYGYETNGKRGVSAGLNNVLFIRKGDALGSKTRAEDDFAADFVEP